ncbi:hypothetical protein M2307_008075, partial [Bradyrhizobium japonicum]|uniref:hypothetical protein n=2 Tax=Bradyrhizobium japonicum TaxID=375 RepID=UPI001AEEFD03
LAIFPRKVDFSCFGYHPDLESRLTFQEKWVLGSQNYAWINACGLLIVLHVLLDFHDDQSSPLSWREVLVHSLYVRCFSQRLHRSPDVLDDGPLCS